MPKGSSGISLQGASPHDGLRRHLMNVSITGDLMRPRDNLICRKVTSVELPFDMGRMAAVCYG
jgi:hypothetical protein